MKFQIKNWWSGAVLFECELSAEFDEASNHVRLGAAVKLAIESNANLTGADLTGADLTGADLTPIRDDLWAVLSSSPAEVPALRRALVDGKVDGSSYQGDCACLVGTIANSRKCYYEEIPGLTPNPSRPAERFFLSIREGDTPENNQFARLAVEWIDQWLNSVRQLVAVSN